MTTYNTGNAIGSTDARDLYDNSQTLDQLVNGSGTYSNRLGVQRRTLAKLEADFDDQLADAESDLNVYRADAAASAAQALGYLNTIRTTSYGAYATDPATDPLGNPPNVGDEYFNTTANLLKRWNGTTWQASDINTANLAAPSGSSLVGYMPSGTGAVATTVQKKLEETVSLFDFMTAEQIADATARIASIDLTDIINAAFAEAKEVIVPDGKFRCTRLEIPNGVTLRGVGFRSHLYSVATTEAIKLNAVNDVAIKDLELECVYANTDVKGISATNCNGITVTGVRIKNTGNSGFFTPEGSFCNNLKIIGNELINTGDFGVHVQGGDNITISNNIISGNDYVNYPPHSIYLKYNCTNITISGNVLRDCIGTNGQAIKLAGVGTAWCDNAAISGNSIEGCFGGLYLYHASNVSFTGNTIKNSKNSVSPANNARNIALYDSNKNIIIIGNTIDSQEGRGLSIEAVDGTEYSTNITVLGNFIDVPINAVYCRFAKKLQIVGNSLLNKSSTSEFTVYIRTTDNVSVLNNTITAGSRHVMMDLTCNNVSIHGNLLLDNPVTPVPDFAIRLDNTCNNVHITGNNLKNLTNGYIIPSATYQSVFGNIGSSANDVDRTLSIGTGSPASGTWRSGDLFRNRAPAELGTVGSKYVITGWICTATGTPGTWIELRSLTGN